MKSISRPLAPCKPFDLLISALEHHGCAPRVRGNRAMAYCPIHERQGKHRRSLSVSESPDGKALLHCFAGCPTEQIVSAIGLTMAHLYPQPSPHEAEELPTNPVHQETSLPHTDSLTFQTKEEAIAELRRRMGGPESASYPYYTAEGQLIGLMLRWETPNGKEIRPVSLHPDGWRIAAMPEPRPLYNLPALLANPGAPVYVVEGEKAVEAATSCGLLATTSSGGARAAHKTDWKPLSGRVVFLLPDADGAGEDYAQEVAHLLYTVGAAEVRILRLAEHCQHLPAGGDLADLIADPEGCGAPKEARGSLQALRNWVETLAKEAEPVRPPKKSLDLDALDAEAAVRAAAQILAESGAPLYVRAGRLATVERDETGHALIRTETADRIRWKLTQYIRILRGTREVLPPDWLTRMLAVMHPEDWPFPPLRGLTYSPPLRPDGTLHLNHGYDPLTGLYYAGPTLRLELPQRPTQRDAARAATALMEPFRDFPFVAEEHLAVVLALMLTVIMRPLISGPVPAFAAISPVQGTGKGLLIDAVAMITTGEVAQKTPYTTAPDEMRKRVFTAVLAGTPLVCLDNITATLSSDALAMVLTTQSITDRLLGTMEMVTVEARTVWTLTANNLLTSEDLARRILPIELDPQVEFPEERTGFRYPRLLAHLRRSRMEYLRHLYTIATAWLQSAPRPGELPAMGSYEEWSDLVRQAVVWCGMADPVEAQRQMRRQRSTEREAIAELFRLWRQVFPEPITLGELIRQAQSDESNALLQELWQHLCGLVGGRSPSPQRLAHALRRYEGRIVEGQRLVRHPRTRAGIPWSVQPTTSSSQSVEVLDEDETPF